MSNLQIANGRAWVEYGMSKKTPVVFIHGFPLSHAMWDEQMKLLSSDRKIISYDIRGFGQSEVGDGQYSMELFVDDLFQLMTYTNIEKAILCGLSMGGYIALRAIEKTPERVAGLILCDTKSEADSNEAKIKRAATAEAVKKDGLKKFAADFLKSVLTEKTFQTKPELIQNLTAVIEKNSPKGIAGALLAMAGRTDTTPNLSKIKVPTLVLVGEEDKLTPPAASKAMAVVIPGAKMEIIPAAAHLSNLENPSVFNTHLLHFLTKV